MDTQVKRIDLSNVSDLEDLIHEICSNMSYNGYRLSSSFTFHNDLILIFQN
jgi:hypothetical protein